MAAPQRVEVISPDGVRGTVAATEVDKLPDGARVLSGEDLAQEKLDAQYARSSTGSKIAGALIGAGAVAPQLEAWKIGGAQGLTGGLYQGLVRQAVDQIAGKKAGKAYEEHDRDLRAAYGGTYQAGEVGGMIGGAVAGSAAGAGGAGLAARALPGASISAVGSAVEGGVARALGNVAARGVAGRAISLAASLGAQGLAEGALYGASQHVGEQLLGDHEVAADKLFAATGMGALYGALGGAALGGAGSLVKSGASAVANKVGSGIARMAEGVEAKAAAKAASEEAAEVGYRTSAKVGDDLATSPSLQTTASRTMRDAANDLAFDALGTTRKVADKINGRVKGGTRAVGGWVKDEVLQSAEGGVARTRADELAPLIQARRDAIGAEIGEVVAANPVRVKVANVVQDASSIHKKMLADPTMIQGAEAFRARVAQTFEAFGNGGKIAEDGTMGLADLYYARAKLEGVAHELGRKSAAEGAAKEWLRNIDSMLVDKLDEAAGAAGKTGEKERLLALKRRYQLASEALTAAEDGTNRIAGNNIFGLREGIAAGVGVATAWGSDNTALGVLGAGATALGGRFLRQRGAGAAALLLSRMAEMGTITRAMQSVDAQLGRSAKGLLNPAPAKAAEAVQARNPIKVAQRAQRQIADLTSSPNAVAERATTLTQGMAQTAPNVAGKVATNLTRALAFLNSKLPPQRNVDPLAPNQPRSWTQTEAERFSRYVDAAEDPIGTLKDIERGKVTPEAVETLRVLTPTLYRDLQIRTLDAIAEQLATGKQVTFESRIKLGTLLGIQADPSQNPRVRTWLQGNIAAAPQAAGGKMQPAPAGPVQRPIKLKTQYSAFDRLAEGGPGRR